MYSIAECSTASGLAPIWPVELGKQGVATVKPCGKEAVASTTEAVLPAK